MTIVSNISQQIKSAEAYLEALAPNTKQFTFQTFPDAEEDKDITSLIKIYHGTLQQHFKELCELNDKGAGIFVTVQETNLKGRKEEDIVNIRAYFCDHDNELPQYDSYHLEPTFIVSSSGNKGHSYWLLNESEKVNNLEVDKANFQSLQCSLINYYNSDPSCKDLARVMRLPGFWHCKNKEELELVSFEKGSDKTYSREEIFLGIPVVSNVKAKTATDTKKVNSKAKNYKLSFRELLAKLTEEMMEITEHRNNALFDRTLILAKRAKQLKDESLLIEIKEEISAAAQLTGLTDTEIDKTTDSAINTGFYKEDNLASADTGRVSKVTLMSNMVEELDIKFDKLNDVILLDNQVISEEKLWKDLCIKSGVDFSFESLMRIVKDKAQSKTFCPIQAYLLNLPVNDSPEETLNKLYKSLHVTDDLSKTLIRKWLISAVARALTPGCQADNALIFYSAKQGYYKTSFFRELFGSSFFQTLGHHKSEVDELQSLYKKWCAEHGEIEFAMSQKEVGRLKAFITQTEDTFRGSYDRRATTKQRHFVFCGTTNKEQFLRDNTGNRRFWVVEINKKIDITFIKENRDLVWAAILALYNSREEWWLNESSENELQQATQRYEQENLYIETVARYIDKHNPCTVADIMKNALEMPVHQLKDKGIQSYVTDALKELGCYKKQQTINGGRAVYWHNPKYQPKPELKEGDF